MSVQVSVVIPTQNRPTVLATTLASVLAQQGVAVEVIVVDFGALLDRRRSSHLPS